MTSKVTITFRQKSTVTVRKSGSSSNVTVTRPAQSVVKVSKKGQRGEQGLQGEQGEAILNGYNHTQNLASNSWVINHNLGHNPTVDIIDSTGSEIEAEVLHPSVNQTIINFSVSIIGKARLV